jgi:protein-disulfide isomerase
LEERSLVEKLVAVFFRLMRSIQNYIVDEPRRKSVRVTVTLDDALYEKALEMADPEMDQGDLFREALETFVRVQAAKRLAALGGRAASMRDVPRRRDEPKTS